MLLYYCKVHARFWWYFRLIISINTSSISLFAFNGHFPYVVRPYCDRSVTLVLKSTHTYRVPAPLHFLFHFIVIRNLSFVIIRSCRLLVCRYSQFVVFVDKYWQQVPVWLRECMNYLLYLPRSRPPGLFTRFPAGRIIVDDDQKCYYSLKIKKKLQQKDCNL